MSIGAIGLTSIETGEAIQYFSHRNLLDFQLIIWNVRALTGETGGQTIRSQLVDEHLSERNDAFTDFFQHGRNLVVLLPPPTTVYIDHYGTSIPAPITRFVPLCPSIAHQTGSSYVTRFRGPDDPLARFWQSGARFFPRYDAYLEEPVGRPFLFAPGTEQRVLGTLLPELNGHVLFLPPLADLGAWNPFCELLSRLFAELSPTEEPVPDWFGSYATAKERAISARLSELGQQRTELDTKFESCRSDLRSEQQMKLLISSSGDTLEERVRLALIDLGISAEPGPTSLDDLVLSFDGQAGIAEVKGVGGSAALSHASQLERWLSERQLAGEENVKGFLIVNAFRNQPLSARTDPIFPSNVVSYSTARGHCLLSTAQLYSMVLEAREQPERREQIARLLWTTTGLLPGYNDLLPKLSVTATQGETTT